MICATILISSCNKILDVKPLKEITSKDLLETRKGYETALGGLYYGMTNNSLYGENLSYGTIDALAGYYEIGSSEHKFYDLGKYDYSKSNVEGQLNVFWSLMYKIIFNANNIINTLEKKGTYDKNEKIIMGEALGLRAYLHLELFRLYGPVVSKEGLSAKSIPYRKVANAVIQPFLPASEFLKNVEEDLLLSEDFLKDDPILTSGGIANGNITGDLDYNSLLDRRRDRFNVNAVTALLARLYQLKGDELNAAIYAQKTIDVTSAKFVNPNELAVSTTRDFRLTKEIIFGLYIRDHYKATGVAFGIDDNAVNVTNSLTVNYDKLQNFIYTEPGDYRRVQWFQNTMNYTVFLRYAKPPSAQDQFLAFRPEVSLISLSEMYFILAESKLTSNLQESLDNLNSIRKTRGIQNDLRVVGATTESVKTELIKEARRQYFGEGQLFFLLKRLYHNIDLNVNKSIPASLEIFKLPINKVELNFNN